MALTQAGLNVAQSTGPGVDQLGMMTLPNSFLMGTGTGTTDAAPVAPAASVMSRLPASATAYIGTMGAILALLLVFKFASEHEKSGMEPHLLGIGVWNFVAVGTMSVLSIAATKIVVNKYAANYKPLVDIVNMV